MQLTAPRLVFPHWDTIASHLQSIPGTEKFSATLLESMAMHLSERKVARLDIHEIMTQAISQTSPATRLIAWLDVSTPTKKDLEALALAVQACAKLTDVKLKKE